MREQSSYQDKEPPGPTCQHPISIPGHLITGRPSRGPEPEDPLGTPILWFAIFFFLFCGSLHQLNSFIRGDQALRAQRARCREPRPPRPGLWVQSCHQHIARQVKLLGGGTIMGLGPSKE